jgi:riboflavin-specific deaminase-like protein
MHMMIDNAALVEELVLSEARAWLLLRALSRRAGAGQAVVQACGVRVDDDGRLEEVKLGQGWLDVFPDATPLFQPMLSLAPSVEHLLELYLPMCVGASGSDLVVGHVGQSLDGQIATSTGASCYITGPQDLLHTHRLRALFDVVLVGRATVACDNPRLTTRLVPGDNPTRVVVDPALRAPLERQVFCDGAAPTLVLCREGMGSDGEHHGLAEIAEVPSTGPWLAPAMLLAKLRQMGLRRIFIEGGGVTVSHFLQVGLLDRMHVTISPIFLGQGRPGVSLPKIDSLDRALRPRVRRFALGDDMLFDCQFERTY